MKGKVFQTMYDALLIAKYVIWYCNDKNLIVSNLKLQKLLYFIQAAFLVEKGTPCFYDEIEAWDFGPVIPVVYDKYEMYGGTNIPCIKNNNDEDLFTIISQQDKDIIGTIIVFCAKFTASMLVTITQKQTPWIDAYSPHLRNIIKRDSIKEYFETNKI